MEKIIRVTHRVGSKVCFFLMWLICLYLFLNSIFSTSLMAYEDEHTFFIKDFSLLMMVGLALLIGLIIVCKKYVRRLLDKGIVWMCILTGVWLCLMLLFLLNTPVEMVYDQALVFDGITNFLKGNLSAWQKGGYFYNYPMQNGLLLLFGPVVALFEKNAYAAVQIINLFFFWFTAFGCYGLAKKYFCKSVAFFTYAGMLFMIPLWGYVKYFYGNIIGLGWIVWAVYQGACFLDNYKTKHLWRSVLCALLAIMCKSNFGIFAVAMILVLVLQGLTHKERKCFLMAVALLLAMIAGMKGPSLITGIFTGCDTGGGIPTVRWIAIGLSESSTAPGWYGEDTHEWFANLGHSVEAAKQDAMASIVDSFHIFAQDKWYACRFFARKFASVWNNPTYESFAVVLKGNLKGTLSYPMKDILYNGGIANTVLTLILDALQTAFWFGLFLYLTGKEKRWELKEAVPLIALIGGVIFHLFWEGKCQYTVLYLPMILPYVCEGYRMCAENVKEILFHKKLCALLAAVVLITVWNNELFDSTVKLQSDTGEYIWYCTEATEWKSEEYVNR